MSSLQERVHDLLRDTKPEIVESVPRSVVMDDLMDLLRDAEDALNTAQARVDKIKADIAKIEN